MTAIDEQDRIDQAPRSSPPVRSRLRWAVWLLVAATLLLAVALPLAPVRVATPAVQWPRDPAVPASTTALFMPYRPIDLAASLPCATVRAAAARTGGGSPVLLLGTAPVDSARGQARSLYVTAGAGSVRVTSSGRIVWTGALPAAGDCTLAVRADQTGTRVLLQSPDGTSTVLGGAAGAAVPEVVGFLTDLTGPDGPAPSVVAHPDARFQTSPTPAKLVLVVLSALAVAGCLWLLTTAGPEPRQRTGRTPFRRRARAPAPGGRRFRVTALTADVGVVGALLAWTVAGPIQTDDFYYTLEARTLGVAGFVGNQVRYYNVPELPFVLDQTLLAPLVSLSASPLVLRLPSLVAALLVWWLLTRWILPELVEEPPPLLRLVAGVALLAWWLPWNISARPEPLVTLLWTVTVALVLRGVGRRRVWLIGLAAAACAVAVAVTASGLGCVATMLALLPRWWPVVRDSRFGAWAGAGLVVACATITSTIVFADASPAAALSALRVHREVGPAVPWWQEMVRYWYLTVGPDPNQRGFARQLVVLTTIVLVVGVSVGLRRAAPGPSGRRTDWGVPALGYTAATLALAFSPTKWSHHFGALAAPGALVITVAFAVLLRRRPTPAAAAALLAAVAVVAGVAFHGPNDQVEYSAYGVPTVLPSLLGNPVVWAAVGAAVALAVALRRARAAESGNRGFSPVATVWRFRGWSWPQGLLTTLVVVLVVGLVLQLGSVALATWRLRGSWSMASDTIGTLTGPSSCGFADHAVALTRSAALPPADPAAAGGSTGQLPDYLPAQPTGTEFPGAPLPTDGTTTPDVPPRTAVHSTWAPAATGAPVDVTTPWLQTTAVGTQDAIGVSVTGIPGGPATIGYDYGTTAADGSVVVLRSGALTLPDQATAFPAWRQLLLDGGLPAPSGTTLVRLRLAAPQSGPLPWVAATAPYRLIGTPLGQLLPHDSGVVVDWPLGFNLPCLQPPRVVDGMVEDVPWLVQSQTFSNTPPLTVIDGGGSYSTEPTVSAATVYPGLSPGTTSAAWGNTSAQWGNLVRWQPTLPTDGYRVVHSTRVIPGWTWWPGAGPGPSSDLPPAEDPLR